MHVVKHMPQWLASARAQVALAQPNAHVLGHGPRPEATQLFVHVFFCGYATRAGGLTHAGGVHTALCACAGAFLTRCVCMQLFMYAAVAGECSQAGSAHTAQCACVSEHGA